MNWDDEYHSGRGDRDSLYPLLSDEPPHPVDLPEDFTRPPQPRPAVGRSTQKYPALIAREFEPTTFGGQFTTADQAGILMNVHPDLGPGYLEFQSRDLFVQWTLSESSDLVDFDRQFRTGPASYAGVFLLSGGILRYACQVEPLQFQVPVDYAGLVNTGVRPEPLLQARFYPGMEERPKTGNPRSITWDFPPFGDLPPLIGPLPQRIAYPPHYANSFTIETDAPILVQTQSRSGTNRQSVVVTQRAALSCAPWEIVVLTAQQNQALPCLTWCENTEVVF
jgi:hypothetical protein